MESTMANMEAPESDLLSLSIVLKVFVEVLLYGKTVLPTSITLLKYHVFWIVWLS